MTAASGRLTAASITENLGVERVGRSVRVLDEIDSTNSHVLRSAGAGDPAPDGAVVIAERQSAGRGRLGRSWVAPRGAGLTFTVALHEPLDRYSPSRLTMAATVALVDGIADVTDVEPAIRWPNDVWVGDRKLAGILVESMPLIGEIRFVALGIGLNCLQQPGHFPPALRDRATSLEIESRAPIDRLCVCRAVLRRLDAALLHPNARTDDDWVSSWRERSADIGTRATLIDAGDRFTGRILDIDPRAGLLVQLDTGSRRHFDPCTTTREQPDALDAERS